MSHIDELRLLRKAASHFSSYEESMESGNEILAMLEYGDLRATILEWRKRFLEGDTVIQSPQPPLADD